MSDMNDPRYPVGKFDRPTGPHTADERRVLIEQIAATPSRMRAAVNGLSDAHYAEEICLKQLPRFFDACF